MAKTEKGNAEFKVGNKVVYPTHGVGKIIKKSVQEIAGHQFKSYVIYFDSIIESKRMTLMIPVKRATKVGLRELSKASQLTKAIAIIKEEAIAPKIMWNKKTKDFMNKVNSGSIISVAEVLRDLYINVNDFDRSCNEREVYEEALDRFSTEYAAVNKIDKEKALKKITRILIAKTKKFK